MDWVLDLELALDWELVRDLELALDWELALDSELVRELDLASVDYNHRPDYRSPKC